jgi:hypothetical protein
VFWISYLCWIAGRWAHFAAITPAEMQRFGIGWSLKLTNEGGHIVALPSGLLIGNFLPGVALKEAVRPELYIKLTELLSASIPPRWLRQSHEGRRTGSLCCLNRAVFRTSDCQRHCQKRERQMGCAEFSGYSG